MDQDTIETYNKIAEGYNQRNFSHFWTDEFEYFTSLLSGKKRVVDLGCGTGRDAEEFFKNGLDHLGIDASEGMLKVARNRVPAGQFEQMDFSHTTFPDGVFDGFWASASLLHLPKKDVSAVIDEARRITKPGGVGFISIKAKTEMDEGFILEERYGGMGRYFAFYMEEEFRTILEEYGFTVLNITTRIEQDKPKTKWLCYFVKI